MIPILLSIKNLRLTSFPKLSLSNKNGTLRILSAIMTNATIRLSNLFSAVLNAIFLNIVPTMLLLTISCGTMVKGKARFFVKSARLIFHQLKIIVSI